MKGSRAVPHDPPFQGGRALSPDVPPVGSPRTVLVRFDPCRKYLRKRDEYLAAAVSVLEVDGLLEGERLLPHPLTALGGYARNVWTVHHRDGHRSWRGWGWNDDDEPPTIDWRIEEDVVVEMSLAGALDRAVAFNPWERIAGTEPVQRFEPGGPENADRRA